MANVAPVGEDLSDADDVNEVGVRTNSPLSPSSSSTRAFVVTGLTTELPPSSAERTGDTSRRVATRDATECHPRRNEVSPRKRYGVPPGNSTG